MNSEVDTAPLVFPVAIAGGFRAGTASDLLRHGVVAGRLLTVRRITVLVLRNIITICGGIFTHSRLSWNSCGFERMQSMFFSTGNCKKAAPVRPIRARGFLLPLNLRSLPPSVMIILISIVHFGAVPCVLFSSLPVLLKSPSFLLIAVSGVLSIRRVRAHAGIQLMLTPRGDWLLFEAAGPSRAVRPVSGLIPHAGLVLLTVRDENGELYPFVFTSWNTDADTLRRLRVRLKATGY